MKFVGNIVGDSNKVSAMAAFMSILSVAALSMNEAAVPDEVVEEISSNSGHLTGIFVKLACSIENYSIISVLSVFFCYILYKYSFSIRRAKTNERVLGVLLSLTFVFGKAFEELATPAILFDGVIQSIKTLIIIGIGCIFFTQLVKAVILYSKENISLSSGFDMVDDIKYRRCMFLFIVAAWLVTYIAFFPGVFQGDTDDIIYMAYNYHTDLVDTVVRIDENNMWVDHHSIFYTVLLGAFVKGARALCGDENVGIIIYTIIQGLFSAWVLAYSLYKLKKWGVPPFIRTCIAVFFAFFPWISRHALMATKDTFFADFLLLYILLIADIVIDAGDKIQTVRIVKLIVYAVLMFALRKNGLYVSLLSIPFLLMINKKWIKYIAVAFVSIFAIKFAYSHILLPALHIPDGSMNAALTVPLQQTARYLHYFPDDVTDEEKQAISRVLDYDAMSEQYQPDQADHVRVCWRKEADMEDFAYYMKAWGTMFIKHPLTYVAATAHGNYAHFYPYIIDLDYFEKSSEGSYQSSRRDNYFDFHHVENGLTMTCRKFLRVTDKLLEKLPLVNLLCTSALYIWILVFAWTAAIVRKDRKLLMLVIPLLMLMLTIITGPCNGNVYPRFVYPVAMCAPVVAAFGFRT